MTQLSKNFTSQEFVCHCGCGGCDIDPKLIDNLQKLRDLIDKPITIVSGFRCKTHNSACGGARNSQHMLGTAADIQVIDLQPEAVAKAAEKIAAFHGGGIGVYKTWVHVDIRHGMARWRG